MSLIGKQIKSKASGIVGSITGNDHSNLIVTFTKFQDVSIPLVKAEDLLIMDEETVEEIEALIRKNRLKKNESEHVSKVQTYMDNFEEEEEEDVLEEEPDLQLVQEGEEEVE